MKMLLWSSSPRDRGFCRLEQAAAVAWPSEGLAPAAGVGRGPALLAWALAARVAALAQRVGAEPVELAFGAFGAEPVELAFGAFGAEPVELVFGAFGAEPGQVVPVPRGEEVSRPARGARRPRLDRRTTAEVLR